jgi:hypothetical protein
VIFFFKLTFLLAGEERKMEAEHAENEAAAAADHKRFVKESRQQLAKQETGHFMQARLN